MMESNLSTRSSGIKKMGLKTLIWFSLGFWVWILFDLLLHPLTAGPNEGGAFFRWLSAIGGSVTVLTALYLMQRVQRNPVVTLLLLWGVGAAGWSIRSEWADPGLGSVALVVFGIYFFCIACPAVILMFFMFPDGKPFPHCMERWVPLIVVVLAVGGLFYLIGLPSDRLQGNVLNPLAIPALTGTGISIYLAVLTVGMLVGLVSLAMRYRVGDDRQRLQLKWLGWLLAVGIALVVIPGEWLSNIFSIHFARLVAIVSFLYWQIMAVLGISIALLRHNLWDIDVIIRKTLLYGVLTGLLALVYFGGVTLLQSLLSAVSGQRSAIAIVISTLTIAVLFNPLRRRVQDFIDRRFFRKKYDAQRILANFASVARDEVDIERLTSALMDVVRETMQPKRVSLWLKPVSTSPIMEGRWR